MQAVEAEFRMAAMGAVVTNENVGGRAVAAGSCRAVQNRMHGMHAILEEFNASCNRAARALRTTVQPASKLLDKRALQNAVADLDDRMGLVHDPTATAEKSQAMMLARGVKPADRFLSGDIMRMRHEYRQE
jgi:hypothetical protein